MSDSPIVEYIPAEEYSESAESAEQTQIQIDDWDLTMQQIASKSDVRLRVPRNTEFTRKDVVQAFSNAFELIGGTPRLALWAHSNEGDFFKLYSRLLPSQASSALGEANELVIKHVLPRGPLDQ